jgi:hypothetical protein
MLVLLQVQANMLSADLLLSTIALAPARPECFEPRPQFPANDDVDTSSETQFANITLDYPELSRYTAQTFRLGRWWQLLDDSTQSPIENRQRRCGSDRRSIETLASIHFVPRQ